MSLKINSGQEEANVIAAAIGERMKRNKSASVIVAGGGRLLDSWVRWTYIDRSCILHFGELRFHIYLSTFYFIIFYIGLERYTYKP